MVNLLLLISLSFGSQYHCVFQETGDLPKIKFRGQTREEAMERTVKLCISMRSQQYFTLRYKNPSPERLIVFMEDCVNKTYCKEIEK
jgi:hypothetical protein